MLNNDTVLVDDSLERMFNVIVCGDSDVVGCVNYYYSRPDTIWQTGSTCNFKTGKIRPIVINEEESDSLINADCVPGSSLMGRVSLLYDNGFLDKQYFAYFEEIDWCTKAKKQGYKVSVLKGTKLLHKVGKSSHGAATYYLRTRNELYFYRKLAGKYFLFIYTKTILKSLAYASIKNMSGGEMYLHAFILAVSDFHKREMFRGNFEKFI